MEVVAMGFMCGEFKNLSFEVTSFSVVICMGLRDAHEINSYVINSPVINSYKSNFV